MVRTVISRRRDRPSYDVSDGAKRISWSHLFGFDVAFGVSSSDEESDCDDSEGEYYDPSKRGAKATSATAAAVNKWSDGISSNPIMLDFDIEASSDDESSGNNKHNNRRKRVALKKPAASTADPDVISIVSSDDDSEKKSEEASSNRAKSKPTATGSSNWSCQKPHSSATPKNTSTLKNTSQNQAGVNIPRTVTNNPPQATMNLPTTLTNVNIQRAATSNQPQSTNAPMDIPATLTNVEIPKIVTNIPPQANMNIPTTLTNVNIPRTVTNQPQANNAPMSIPTSLTNVNVTNNQPQANSAHMHIPTALSNYHPQANNAHKRPPTSHEESLISAAKKHAVATHYQATHPKPYTYNRQPTTTYPQGYQHPMTASVPPPPLPGYLDPYGFVPYPLPWMPSVEHQQAYYQQFQAANNMGQYPASAGAGSQATPMGRAQDPSEALLANQTFLKLGACAKPPPPAVPDPLATSISSSMTQNPVATFGDVGIQPSKVPANSLDYTPTTGLPFQVTFASPSKVRPPQGKNMSWRRLHSLNGQGFASANELLWALHYYKPGHLRVSKKPPTPKSDTVEFVWESTDSQHQEQMHYRGVLESGKFWLEEARFDEPTVI